MKIKLEQQLFSNEAWDDEYEKRRANLFKEFNPKLNDLNNRIIAYLLEHGIDNDEELKDIEKEGEALENQFDQRVEQEDKDFRQQFGNQYRGLELGFDDFKQDRHFKEHDRHMKDVRQIMKQKPTTGDLRRKIEELKKEAKPWEKLQKEVNASGREYLLNPISNAVYDKESEISGLAVLLKEEVEKMKDISVDYTAEDLEKAEKDLERANEIGMSGNNPNAGRAIQKAARSRLRTVKEVLKQSGQVEKTPEEKLTEELDNLYPNAKSKTVVEHRGKKYQVRYFPLESSRTGKTVFEWGHSWIPFSEELAKKFYSKRSSKK